MSMYSDLNIPRNDSDPLECWDGEGLLFLFCFRLCVDDVIQTYHVSFT